MWTTSNSTHIHYTGVTLLACVKLQIKHKSQEKHQITIRLERIAWICFSFHFDFVRRIWCVCFFCFVCTRVSIFFSFHFIVFGWYKHEQWTHELERSLTRLTCMLCRLRGEHVAVASRHQKPRQTPNSSNNMTRYICSSIYKYTWKIFPGENYYDNILTKWFSALWVLLHWIGDSCLCSMHTICTFCTHSLHVDATFSHYNIPYTELFS